MADHETRERWNQFKKLLDDAGVQCRCLWEARTSPDKRWPDLVCWQLATGTENGERVMIVQHYDASHGRDGGFGLFYPSMTNSMEDDVRRIMGD